jgi:hypothetical protein
MRARCRRDRIRTGRSLHHKLTQPAPNHAFHESAKLEGGSMLKDGTYAAWFKTALGEGTGIVHFADGKLWGRDSIVTYDGSYQISGERFTAILRTKRHTAGHATVFGIDELELKIEGTALGRMATCTATTDAAPGIVLEATLIPCEAPPSPVEPPRTSKFDLGRLPKLPRRSR